jgi:tetratricopeptide (TPR) repeat protein
MIFLNLFLYISLLFVSPEQINPLPVSSCKEYMDAAKKARADKNRLLEISILEEGIVNQCADSSIAYSQLSLCYLELADQSYSDRNENNENNRLENFTIALDFANQAIQIDPDNVYGYERKSMAFAGLVDVQGLKQKVQLADSVRINAEIALELDPKNDRALHILGRWHYEVSQFGGFMRFLARLFFGTAPKASYEQALHYFTKSAELQDYPVHHYWIGITHLKLNNDTSAKNHFEYLLSLENQHHNDQFFKDQAKQKLEDLN